MHRRHVIRNINNKNRSIAYDFDHIAQKIKERIELNVKKALTSKYVINGEGIFSRPDFSRLFSITGSLKVPSLDVIGISKSYFINKEDRFFICKTGKNVEYHLRGPRYVAAIDPSLSLTQKINIIYIDIIEGVDLLIDLYAQGNIWGDRQYIELSPLLDYIKNGLITLYNAYTNKEKIGRIDTDKKEYGALKEILLDWAKEATLSFYLSLINKFKEPAFNNFLNKIDKEVLFKITNEMITDFKDYKFSSRALVRAEATHPLILLAFTNNILNKFPNAKFIFGMPSGGTELACLLQKALEYEKGQKTELILLPISLHSIPVEYKNNNLSRDHIKQLIPKNAIKQKYINGLIVDDNSATGETIELAQKIIKKANKTFNLACYVAEADIIRIKLKMKESDKMANDQVYEESVGVLPVSKRIWPKYDIKELVESRQLSKFYKSKESKESLIQLIKAEVISDAIENKYEFIKPLLKKETTIFEFKHMFLSNFWTVHILYKGQHYPSVEHAYLAQKYKEEDLKNLSKSEKNTLNNILKIKGMHALINDFSLIFTKRIMPAGIVKRISNQLKDWGYEKKDWDDYRLDLMIELLIQKFSNKDFLQQLLDTDDAYLIEGNTWNDFFWGICNDRGRNFLGRIIMNIREKIISGEIK